MTSARVVVGVVVVGGGDDVTPRRRVRLRREHDASSRVRHAHCRAARHRRRGAPYASPIVVHPSRGDSRRERWTGNDEHGPRKGSRQGKEPHDD